MQEIDEKKKSLAQCQNAANLAVAVEDFYGAYMNYLSAIDLARDISSLTLSVEETDDYLKLADKLEMEAKTLLPKLKLSPEEANKISKRKKPKGFDKFVGEERLKDYLTKTVIEPWKKHDLSSRGKSAILLYGPEGVSKTVLVQSLIHELNATGYYLEPIRNFSPYSETTKEKMKSLFKLAEEKDNVVFYFPKPNAFFPNGKKDESADTFKIFYKLLKKEIKRVKKLNLNILFVASTSAPDKMNPKMFAKGLFDDLLRIHHPDRYTRKGLMEERLDGVEFEDPGTIDKLVPITHGYISKEVSRLCRRIKKTAKLYAQDGKDAIITPAMIDRIMMDLGPMDDIEFKKNVDAFEAGLPKDCSIINDNHD